MQPIWFFLFCLCGQISLTVGSLNDTNMILEISESPEGEKIDIFPSGIDTRVKLVDTTGEYS